MLHVYENSNLFKQIGGNLILKKFIVAGKFVILKKNSLCGLFKNFSGNVNN